MTWLMFEWRLIARSRLSAAALLLLLLFTALAVWSGLHEIARQRATIARLAPLHQQDVAALAARYPHSADAGSPAYYTFYNTWDPPSQAAFLALGLRDVAPYVLRVRALGLQAQLYEGESFNPEAALAGRFDFAFVLIYLTPLFVIALLHDVVSAERESGRLRLLQAMPSTRQLWRRRIGLRYALLLACLIVPPACGAVWSQTLPAVVLAVLAVSAAYLAFWVAVAVLVATSRWRSVANATALMGVWAALVLVLPTLANLVLVRAIPVHQGVDLMLTQRQVVHGAWEVPREEIMRKFYAGHPDWKHSAPLSPGFHYKWYFAFHQLGDESVASDVRAYRNGLLARQTWSDRLGWILPGVAAQSVLHRLADTDLPAQLAYQDRIAAFHGDLRHFYYGYLFNERPFGSADFSKLPAFTPRPAAMTVPWTGLLVLLAVAALALGAALRRFASLSAERGG